MWSFVVRTALRINGDHLRVDLKVNGHRVATRWTRFTICFAHKCVLLQIVSLGLEDDALYDATVRITRTHVNDLPNSSRQYHVSSIASAWLINWCLHTNTILVQSEIKRHWWCIIWRFIIFVLVDYVVSRRIVTFLLYFLSVWRNQSPCDITIVILMRTPLRSKVFYQLL